MVTFLEGRVNEELECVGCRTDDAEAAAFRETVIAGVMLQPSIVDQHIDHVGRLSEGFREVTFRLARDIHALATDSTLTIMQVVRNHFADSNFMRYWAYHEIRNDGDIDRALKLLMDRIQLVVPIPDAAMLGGQNVTARGDVAVLPEPWLLPSVLVLSRPLLLRDVTSSLLFSVGPVMSLYLVTDLLIWRSAECMLPIAGVVGTFW